MPLSNGFTSDQELLHMNLKANSGLHSVQLSKTERKSTGSIETPESIKPLAQKNPELVLLQMETLTQLLVL